MMLKTSTLAILVVQIFQSVAGAAEFRSHFEKMFDRVWLGRDFWGCNGDILH